MSKNETIRALKDFNAHLRNEIHELKDKLKAEQKKSQGFFKDMIEAELKCDSLNDVVEKLQTENAALKSQKGSIFTDPEKCRNKPTEDVNT